MNLLDDGQICLEFLKPRDGQDRIVEVFRISPDGRQVSVYQPMDTTVRDEPTPAPDKETIVKTYSYDSLPHKYWKRYQYASR